MRFVTPGEVDWTGTLYADRSHIAHFARSFGIKHHKLLSQETLCTGVVFLTIQEVDPVEVARERMVSTIAKAGHDPNREEAQRIKNAINCFSCEVQRPMVERVQALETEIKLLSEQAEEDAKNEARLKVRLDRYDQFLNDIRENAERDWTCNSLVMKINVFKRNLLANQN